jgi:hypothetical protein
LVFHIRIYCTNLQISTWFKCYPNYLLLSKPKKKLLFPIFILSEAINDWCPFSGKAISAVNPWRYTPSITASIGS